MGRTEKVGDAGGGCMRTHRRGKRHRAKIMSHIKSRVAQKLAPARANIAKGAAAPANKVGSWPCRCYQAVRHTRYAITALTRRTSRLARSPSPSNGLRVRRRPAAVLSSRTTPARAVHHVQQLFKQRRRIPRLKMSNEEIAGE